MAETPTMLDMEQVAKTDTGVVKLVIVGLMLLGGLAMVLSIGGVVALLLLDKKVPDAMWPIAGTSFGAITALAGILASTRSVTPDAPHPAVIPPAAADVAVPPLAGQFGTPPPVVDDSILPG